MSSASNVSSPDATLGWVSEPDGRGTFGIILICVTVILLNTWTVIHPNIQPITQSDARNELHKLNLAFIAAFAPDAVAASAFSQWRHARRSVKDLKDELPWWKLEHGFYAEMGGYRVISRASGQEYSIRSPQLAWLYRRKMIEIPEVDTKNLEERSKAEPIGKLIACLQSAWFLVSTLARFDQRLSVTTLEAEMFPYVVVTWGVYYCWWKKPMQLTSYTKVYVDDITPQQLIEMAQATCSFDKSPPWWRPMPQEMHPWGWDYYWMTKRVEMKKLRFENTRHLVPPTVRKAVRMTMAEWEVADWYRPSVNEGHPNEWDVWDGFVIYLVGVWLYGFPLSVWNYEFPTNTEKLLWKVTNVGSIVLITLWAPLGYALHWLGGRYTAPWKETAYYFIVTAVFIGRLYVMVEVFLGLRSCPPGVYKSVEWSLYIPHIS